MLEDTLLNYLLLYGVLELFEVQWQKAQTLLGVLARMYEQYKKSAFVFLLLHPTLYFAIMFVLMSDYNGYAIALLSLKSLDIVTKMLLLKKVFIERSLSQELQLSLLQPLPSYMLYVGLFVYLPLIYMVFSSGM